MKVHLSESFKRKAHKLLKWDTELRKILNNRLDLFKSYPHHPSLHTHKLTGKRSKQYAIMIKENLRALFIAKRGTAVFFDLITHDEY